MKRKGLSSISLGGENLKQVDGVEPFDDEKFTLKWNGKTFYGQ